MDWVIEHRKARWVNVIREFLQNNIGFVVTPKGEFQFNTNYNEERANVIIRRYFPEYDNE